MHRMGNAELMVSVEELLEALVFSCGVQGRGPGLETNLGEERIFQTLVLEAII